VVGKLEGDPATTRGYYDICREDFNPQDWNHRVFSIRTGPASTSLMPVPRVAFMPARCITARPFGRRRGAAVGGGTIGHPMGIQAVRPEPRGAGSDDPRAQRGRDYLHEGPEILARAAATARR